MVFQETSLVPSMTVAQNLYLGAEKLPQPAARHLHLRPAVPAVAELPRRSDRHGRDPRRRQAADGRDRPRRPPQGRGHHLRRADGDADARGEAPLLRADAPAEGARRLDRLHQPRAGGGAGASPTASPSCATANWWRPARPPTSTATRSSRAMVGRTLSGELYRKRDDAERCASPARKVLSVQDISMGNDGAQQLLLDLRGPDHRRLRPDRLRPHRDLQGRLRHLQARLLRAAARSSSTTSRCATTCRAEAVRGRHRLRHRGPQDRRLLRDHVDRRELCSAGCSPRAARQGLIISLQRDADAGRGMDRGGSTSRRSTTMRASSSCPAATSRRW